jgi:hypothetical protein
MGTGATSAGRRPRFAMNFCETLAEIGDERAEWAPQCCGAGDDYIIESCTRPGEGPRSQSLTEAAADAIADDGCPEALGHCEAESRPVGRAVSGAGLGLEHECTASPPCSAPDRQKLGPFAQADERMRRFVHSGREPLASLGAAPHEHEAAATGGHARAEAVPAFAHELARLIRSLHDRNSRSLINDANTTQPTGHWPGQVVCARKRIWASL